MQRFGFGAAGLGLLAAGIAAGCGDDSGGTMDGAPSDGGRDAIVIDARPDVGGGDSGGDTGTDSGNTDGGVDCRGLGAACGARPCIDNGDCIEERQGAFGGAMDPIQDFDGGTVNFVAWRDGYCTTVLPSQQNPLVCDPADETSCGPCGTCVEQGDSTVCFLSCEPSNDSNSCREGYECSLGDGVCLPGCTTDAECRIYRADTDGDGEITEYDSTTMEGDNLVYDLESDATCDQTTFRCTHSGTAEAAAGDECEKASQCEADGFCITEPGAGWPGGYCSKTGCDVEGRECAGDDSVCMGSESGFGIDLCLDGCTVAGETGMDYEVGPEGHGEGCRAGYRCLYNGFGAAGEPGNGGCIPGNYNEVTTPNVGAGCESNDDCYSRFGSGRCFTGFPGGYCLLDDCAAPGMPEDVCGDTGICVSFQDGGSVCFEECQEPADCRPGYACTPISSAEDSPSFCFAGCNDNTECRDGATCVDGQCVGEMVDGGVPDGGMGDAGVPDSGTTDGGTDAAVDAAAADADVDAA